MGVIIQFTWLLQQRVGVLDSHKHSSLLMSGVSKSPNLLIYSDEFFSVCHGSASFCYCIALLPKVAFGGSSVSSQVIFHQERIHVRNSRQESKCRTSCYSRQIISHWGINSHKSTAEIIKWVT